MLQPVANMTGYYKLNLADYLLSAHAEQALGEFIERACPGKARYSREHRAVFHDRKFSANNRLRISDFVEGAKAAQA